MAKWEAQCTPTRNPNPTLFSGCCDPNAPELQPRCHTPGHASLCFDNLCVFLDGHWASEMSTLLLCEIKFCRGDMQKAIALPKECGQLLFIRGHTLPSETQPVFPYPRLSNWARSILPRLTCALLAPTLSKFYFKDPQLSVLPAVWLLLIGRSDPR